MGTHTEREVGITPLEADHILTALRGFYGDKDEYEWCTACSTASRKILPIAQAEGFKLNWVDPSLIE